MSNNKEEIRRQRRLQNRRRVRRQRIAVAIFMAVILAMIVFLIIRFMNKPDQETVIDNPAPPIEEVIPPVETPPVELTAQEKKQYVLDHPEEYTEGLIGFMNNYDQVIDYVYHYKDRDSISATEAVTDAKTGTAFPLYIQWDARWGYEEYGESLIGIAGCGPTTLAMAYEGLTGKTDQTPSTICDISEQNGYYVEGSGTTWNLITKGVYDIGLTSQEIPLYESKLVEELQKGSPIICNVGPGDFTQGGHYILVIGYKDGKFMINDPNSIENSNKLWEYSVLQPQIKNLWAIGK